MRLPSIKFATTTFLMLSVSNLPSKCQALPDKDASKKTANSNNDSPSKDDKDNNVDVNSFINNMATKGKAAFDAVDPDFVKRFGPFFEKENVDDISKHTLRFFEAGSPGKIGYGFMMGYSSGFCLKKVSKVLAFVVGGLFVGMQTLSFNGYMIVNYEKLQKDVEHVLDLNKDGKLDEKDFNFAYAKMLDALKYNMPSGGGFTIGFIAGLRS